jgi:hypothetical protein
MQLDHHLVTIALALSSLLPACSLSEALPPEELQNTERGSFTSDGRFFVVGSRAADRSDAGSWIVEVSKGPQGNYVATNYVAGTLEGTRDGLLGGSPAGDPCVFSGMARHGNLLYVLR